MSSNTVDAKTRMKDLAARRDQAYKTAHDLSRELWDEVAESGMGASEIAKTLGVTRATVYGWLRQREAEGNS